MRKMKTPSKMLLTRRESEQNSLEKKENQVDRKDNDDAKLDTKQQDDDPKKGSEYVNLELPAKKVMVKVKRGRKMLLRRIKTKEKVKLMIFKLEQVVQSEEIFQKRR